MRDWVTWIKTHKQYKLSPRVKHLVLDSSGFDIFFIRAFYQDFSTGRYLLQIADIKNKRLELIILTREMLEDGALIPVSQTRLPTSFRKIT